MAKAVVGHVYQGRHTQNDLALECVNLVMIDRSSIAPKAGLMLVKGRKKGWSLLSAVRATRHTASCWVVASTTWSRTAAGATFALTPSMMNGSMSAGYCPE